jgi:methyltransferase (TIGR00027 family)
MRKGRPSLTALAIASARALASSNGGALLNPHDQVAQRLLPKPWSLAVRALGGKLAGPWLGAAATRASLGLVDHVALRTAIIDKAIAASIARGLRQLVILGAGFDTRAHRLEALRETAVYEVDHPDSQRSKRERTEDAPLLAARLEYVPLDLAQGGLRDRLSDAGHRAAEPTLWLAEGLVPYLKHDAVEAMLQEIAAASAARSELAITYVTPDLVWLQHAKPLFLASMQLIGEPVETALSSAELAALLAAIGFQLAHDSDTEDWWRELCDNNERKPLITYERLALATLHG